MPGMLYHLSFTEEVYQKLKGKISIDKVNFFAGNLIPDLTIEKKQSHYRKDASIKGMYVPDMELVKRELYVPQDSLKFGMYCHLYLDYHFIEGFLIPGFIWDFKNNKVTSRRNNRVWDIKTFFSKKGIYTGYGEINPLMVRDGYVSLDILDEMPENLPDTGLEMFDTRVAKTWKEELRGYLSRPKEYTGEIFDYNQLTDYIKKIATQLVEEVII